MTTRAEVRQRLADALVMSRNRSMDADALLPVVEDLVAQAYGQGRDDEQTDVLSARESSASRWWEP